MAVNPYYRYYAVVHGNTTVAQLELDREEYPGGCMCGFTLWISAMKVRFYNLHVEACLDRHHIGDYRRWEQFLQQQAQRK